MVEYQTVTAENMAGILATVGSGFIGGYLVAYFLRRLLKILMFIIGGIFAFLLYLQHQEIIFINVTKLQTYTDGIFTSIISTTAATNISSNQIPFIGTVDYLGIPFTSSISAGFVLGISRL
jgi:uncharacterized membrane protein (Fun14 family)